MTPHAQAVWDALNKPEEWRVGRHTADHMPSKTEFWISNTVFDFGVYKGPKAKFTLWEKFILRRKIRALGNKQLIAVMAAATTEQE